MSISAPSTKYVICICQITIKILNEFLKIYKENKNTIFLILAPRFNIEHLQDLCKKTNPDLIKIINDNEFIKKLKFIDLKAFAGSYIWLQETILNQTKICKTYQKDTFGINKCFKYLFQNKLTEAFVKVENEVKERLQRLDDPRHLTPREEENLTEFTRQTELTKKYADIPKLLYSANIIDLLHTQLAILNLLDIFSDMPKEKNKVQDIMKLWPSTYNILDMRFSNSNPDILHETKDVIGILNSICHVLRINKACTFAYAKQLQYILINILIVLHRKFVFNKKELVERLKEHRFALQSLLNQVTMSTRRGSYYYFVHYYTKDCYNESTSSEKSWDSQFKDILATQSNTLTLLGEYILFDDPPDTTGAQSALNLIEDCLVKPEVNRFLESISKSYTSTVLEGAKLDCLFIIYLFKLYYDDPTMTKITKQEVSYINGTFKPKIDSFANYQTEINLDLLKSPLIQDFINNVTHLCFDCEFDDVLALMLLSKICKVSMPILMCQLPKFPDDSTVSNTNEAWTSFLQANKPNSTLKKICEDLKDKINIPVIDAYKKAKKNIHDICTLIPKKYNTTIQFINDEESRNATQLVHPDDWDPALIIDINSQEDNTFLSTKVPPQTDSRAPDSIYTITYTR